MATTKERLHEAMAQKGLRATDLSERSGLSRGAISQYLSGKVTPKQDKIFILARALGVSPSYLMGADVPSIRSAEIFTGPGGLQLPEAEFKPIPAEELEQMRRDAIARSFMELLFAGKPEILAIIQRATITATGEIKLPDADKVSEAIINAQLQNFKTALDNAKLNDNGKATITFKPNK